MKIPYDVIFLVTVKLLLPLTVKYKYKMFTTTSMASIFLFLFLMVCKVVAFQKVESTVASSEAVR